MLKYYTICLEGIDKSGKDTIAYYIIQLSNYKYIVNCRGLLTQLAYAKLYNRLDLYSTEHLQHSVEVTVLLDVDKLDWQIRCKYTNEMPVDYDSNVAAFNYAFECLKNDCHILRYNTSSMTAYQIAKSVVEAVDKMNNLEETNNG